MPIIVGKLVHCKFFLRTADISALFLGSLRIFIFFCLCQNWFVCSRVSHIWRRHSSSTLVSRFSYSWFAISRLFCWRNIWQNPPNHWWNIAYQNDSHVIHKYILTQGRTSWLNLPNQRRQSCQPHHPNQLCITVEYSKTLIDCLKNGFEWFAVPIKNA